MAKNNGDMPASPIFDSDGEATSHSTWCELGLTKREHFAGLALQGILSSEYVSSFCKEDTVCPAAVSKAAVSYADSLLRELN